MTLELNDPSEKIAAALTTGLKMAADLLLEQSNKLVPVDDGTLRDSGASYVQGRSAVVGYSAIHAVKQHENLRYVHANGGQAKFLETALVSNSNAMQDKIADALRNALS